MKSAVPPPLESAPTLAETEAVFDALAHEVRRHILQLLSQRGGELPSGYLAQKFAHSWPTTTRHLRVLEAAGLVEVRREGRSSFYRLDRDRLRRIAGGWLALLDPPTPETTWRSSGPRTVKKGTSR
jgi:DNA-binding transcriptional ArsR family regulator